MNHAVLVRMVHREGDVPDQRKLLPDRDPAPPLLQLPAVDEFHGEEALPLDDPGLVDADDVRVLRKIRADLGLAEEALLINLGPFQSARLGGRHHLDRDPAVEDGVDRLVDAAHPALADLLQEDVLAEGRALEDRAFLRSVVVHGGNRIEHREQRIKGLPSFSILYSLFYRTPAGSRALRVAGSATSHSRAVRQRTAPPWKYSSMRRMTSSAVIMSMQRGSGPTGSTQRLSSALSPSPSGRTRDFQQPPLSQQRSAPVRMEVLVVGIGFPLGGLAAARHDDAGPVLRPAALHLHGGGQMHGRADAGQHALRMVHKADQLAEIGLPPQVDHVPEGRW